MRVSLLEKWILITTLATHSRRPLISPPLHIKRPVILTSFERGESKDYANIKIFSIGCKIAVHRVKQGKVKFSRSN